MLRRLDVLAAGLVLMGCDPPTHVETPVIVERSARLLDDFDHSHRVDGLRAELAEVQGVRAADVSTAVVQLLRESPRIVVLAEPASVTPAGAPE